MTFVDTAVCDDIVLPEKAAPRLRSRRLWFWILIAGAAGAACYIWRQALIEQYHHWSQGQYISRTTRDFEKGDYEHAILNGRAALIYDPFDVETNRIIAKSYEAQGSFEAISWRARLNLIKPGDVENALAWARDTLKAGDSEAAEDALAVLKPEDQDSAGYHECAARIAMLRGDFAKAESHWSEAIRREPASEDYRLNLATLQVRSHSPAVRAAAGQMLEKLGKLPKHRLAAHRALIEDAMNHQEFQRARDLADALVASPEARFTDRLGRLAVLRDQNAPDAQKYLEQLRDESLRDPDQFSTLISWMNQNGLPLLVSDWVPALPRELISKPPVSLLVADSYGHDRDWTKLREFVETATWKDFDQVRLAHLAHALENFGNVVAAEATWGRALAECHEKPDRLSMLVRLAQAWRWDERAESTLRKLSADEHTPLWVLDALWNISKKSGDSAELHRLSRLIVRARPKNPVARNNFIRLSLLRRLDEGATFDLAAGLFKERPTDIACATTYALALFFQEKVFDALQVMQSFPVAELREPEAAFYYGVFLQASGGSAKADDFLALTRGATRLRDEEDLLARVKRESRFNTLAPKPNAPAQPLKKDE